MLLLGLLNGVARSSKTPKALSRVEKEGLVLILRHGFANVFVDLLPSFYAIITSRRKVGKLSRRVKVESGIASTITLTWISPVRTNKLTRTRRSDVDSVTLTWRPFHQRLSQASEPITSSPPAGSVYLPCTKFKTGSLLLSLGQTLRKN